MDETRNKENYENWSQSAAEAAKHSSLSFTLSGWPAAATLIAIPVSVVAIYAIKTFAHV